MKKPYLSVLILLTMVFIGFILGLFIGRNQDSATVSVSVMPEMQTVPEQTTVPADTVQTTEAAETITFPININTATIVEFSALPGIGEVLAGRIIAYREEFGNFSDVMELMNVEGIGEKRMEEILDLITTGG